MKEVLATTKRVEGYRGQGKRVVGGGFTGTAEMDSVESSLEGLGGRRQGLKDLLGRGQSWGARYVGV